MDSFWKSRAPILCRFWFTHFIRHGKTSKLCMEHYDVFPQKLKYLLFFFDNPSKTSKRLRFNCIYNSKPWKWKQIFLLLYLSLNLLNNQIENFSLHVTFAFRRVVSWWHHSFLSTISMEFRKEVPLIHHSYLAFRFPLQYGLAFVFLLSKKEVRKVYLENFPKAFHFPLNFWLHFGITPAKK